MLVVVTGATGFLGRRVVRELVDRRHQVRCLVHVPGRERIFDHREVEVHYGNVLDSGSLTAAFYNAEAVVHLVAIIRPTRRLTFDLVNRQGAANVAAAAREAGSRQFQYVSALGAASDQSYSYFYSKWQAEQEVVNSGLPYTIIRPGVLFGQGDEFITALAMLVRLFPLTPVFGSGDNRLQPIAAEDLARCIAISLERNELRGTHHRPRRAATAQIQRRRGRGGFGNESEKAQVPCADAAGVRGFVGHAGSVAQGPDHH